MYYYLCSSDLFSKVQFKIAQNKGRSGRLIDLASPKLTKPFTQYTKTPVQ